MTALQQRFTRSHSDQGNCGFGGRGSEESRMWCSSAVGDVKSPSLFAAPSGERLAIPIIDLREPSLFTCSCVSVACVFFVWSVGCDVGGVWGAEGITGVVEARIHTTFWGDFKREEGVVTALQQRFTRSHSDQGNCGFGGRGSEESRMWCSSAVGDVKSPSLFAAPSGERLAIPIIDLREPSLFTCSCVSVACVFFVWSVGCSVGGVWGEERIGGLFFRECARASGHYTSFIR